MKFMKLRRYVIGRHNYMHVYATDNNLFFPAPVTGVFYPLTTMVARYISVSHLQPFWINNDNYYEDQFQ